MGAGFWDCLFPAGIVCETRPYGIWELIDRGGTFWDCLLILPSTTEINNLTNQPQTQRQSISIFATFRYFVWWGGFLRLSVPGGNCLWNPPLRDLGTYWSRGDFLRLFVNPSINDWNQQSHQPAPNLTTIDININPLGAGFTNHQRLKSTISPTSPALNYNRHQD